MDMLPDKKIDADLVGEFSEVVDRGEKAETVLLAGHVILGAMSGSDVDRAGAGLGRDEVSEDQARSPIEERMLRLGALELGPFELDHFAVGEKARLLAEGLDEIFHHDEILRHALLRMCEIPPHVSEERMHRDPEVRRECPRCCRPDHHRGFSGEFAGDEGKLHEDCRIFHIHVLDLGLGESSLGAVAPLHRFLALVDKPFFDECRKDTDDVGLILGREREVGILPVTEDAEAAEGIPLDVDVLTGKGLGTAADLRSVEPAGLFHDLELDRETVAVPARDVGAFVARHRLAFQDEILQHLVQSRAHVDVSVGKGRPVVEYVAGRSLALALFDDLKIKRITLPFFEAGRLPRHEIAPHGELSVRKIQGRFVAGGAVWVAHKSGKNRKAASVAPAPIRVKGEARATRIRRALP